MYEAEVMLYAANGKLLSPIFFSAKLHAPKKSRLFMNKPRDSMTLEELEMLIESCRNSNRLGQKRLYQQFYGFGMSICNRYASNREEAEEMCHDGFMKVLTKIGDCAAVGAFQGWMRRIFIRSAIDYFRKYRHAQPVFDDIGQAGELLSVDSTALDKISTDEKLRLVQKLPPAYRMAFNLYAVEGFSTTEISELLHIAEGTVRANLAKARLQLQRMIHASDKSTPLHYERF